MRLTPLCFLLFTMLFPFRIFAMTAAEQGNVLRDIEHGRADSALSLLQSGTVQNDAQAHQLLCRVSLQLEQWDQAVTECEKAVSLDSGNSDNHMWYGRALGEKADRVSFIKAYGLGKRVKSEFETAASLNPQNAPALADLGEFYTDAPAIVGGGKDKAEAIAVKLDEVDRARAEYLRARIAASNNDNDGALRHFHQAIAASSKPATYWMALASYYQKQKDLLHMQEAIRAGLAARGAEGEPLVDAAHLLIKSGQDPQLAIQLLRQYLNSPVKSEDEPAFRVHLLLASLLNKQGDIAGAQQEIAAAASLASGYHPTKEVATNTGR